MNFHETVKRIVEALIEGKELTNIQRKPRGAPESEWRTVKRLDAVSRDKMWAVMNQFRQEDGKKSVYRFAPAEIIPVGFPQRGGSKKVIEAHADLENTSLNVLSDEDYWSKIPPSKLDGVEYSFDAGKDGCVPSGWYFTGTWRGFPKGSWFGPFDTEQEVLAAAEEDFPGLPVTKGVD